MNTPLHEQPHNGFEVAKKYFHSLELDKALEAIIQSPKNLNANSNSNISCPETILLSEILLAKGRFSADKTFPTRALKHLLATQALLPQLTDSYTFLSSQLLLIEAYTQLNKGEEAHLILDNLLKISKKEGQLIGEIHALNGLGKLAFAQKNISEALSLANQSLELLIQHTDEGHFFVLAENYELLSVIYSKKSDFSQAKNYAERLLIICQEHGLKELEIKAHLILGKIYIQQQENVSAITHLLKAKEESLLIQHNYFLAQAILQIGIVYNHVFHYPKALENYGIVEKEYYDLLNTSNQILLLNYLGKSHFLSFQNELAESYFEKAVNLAKSQKENIALAFSFAYLGKIYARKNIIKKALIFAKRANEIIENEGDIDGAQVNLINLGGIHCQLEKYNEGIKLASRGIAAAKRMKDGFYEIRGYQIMAEIFRKKKDYKSAVMYQRIYTKFYEDFYQRNDRQKICEIESQFVIRKLEKEIERLRRVD